MARTTTLGCLILWLGWYGFNPGSARAMNETVSTIPVTITLGAAGGGIAGTLVSQIRTGKPDLTVTINGIQAGLVGITAGCDALSMPAAWLIGFIGGALVVDAVSYIDAIGIDDPVGAFSVHGFGGVWGTLAGGLFPMDKDLLFTGHGFDQLGLQLLGAGCYVAFTLVVFWILWSALGAMAGGPRVEEHEELAGLDVSEHGMGADPDFVAASTK